MEALPLLLSLGLTIALSLHAEHERRTRVATLTRDTDQLNRLLLATLDYVQQVTRLDDTDGTTP
jgi:hypothetical protein